MITKGETWWGGINQELGMNTHTLLYIKLITNQDLVYSTGNYIQYLVITYNGKESENDYIYIHIYVNHFAVHMKLTQHR